MKITFDNLLNNAIEYFQQSLVEYKAKNYKSAISDLWSGTLLLLKCKLYRIHPILIVTDVLDCIKLELKCYIGYGQITEIENTRQFAQEDKDHIKSIIGKDYSSIDEIFIACNIVQDNKKEALKKFITEKRISFDFDTPDIERDFKTVTLDDIEKRFKQLKESNEVYKKYESKLKVIRIARNRLEHYVNDFNSDQLLAMFEYAIPFINDFLEYELEISAESRISNWSDFLDISALANARLETVEKFINEHTPSYKDQPDGLPEADCPMCGNRAVDIGNGHLYCKFCGNEEDYYICNDCYEVFPVNGYESFHEELGICDNCLSYKVDKD